MLPSAAEYPKGGQGMGEGGRRERDGQSLEVRRLLTKLTGSSKFSRSFRCFFCLFLERLDSFLNRDNKIAYIRLIYDLPLCCLSVTTKTLLKSKISERPPTLSTPHLLQESWTQPRKKYFSKNFPRTTSKAILSLTRGKHQQSQGNSEPKMNFSCTNN